MAPSLLSLYTTASFISASSSSRQFGLQAPTAAGCKRDGERREDHAPPRFLFLPAPRRLSPATCAPAFTHRPKSTGSVLPVTVTMASAPLTASSTETHALTGPPTERQNLSAPWLVRLHTRTCWGMKTIG